MGHSSCAGSSFQHVYFLCTQLRYQTVTMASKNNSSPSKNPISSWFKLLKKSDSPTEQTSSKSNLNAKNSTNNNINLTEIESNDTVSENEDKLDINSGTLPEKESSNKTNALHTPVPIKARQRKNSHTLSLNILSPQKSPSVTPIQNQLLSSSPTPSRPFLGFKSRSSHSFRPLSQFLDTSSSSQINEQGNRLSTSFDSKEKLRSHRDSFLQQKHLDSVGDSTIFGCDIETSTRKAFGTIYISADIEQGLSNRDDDSVHDNAYGKVPLVIVACGSFLKSKGLTVEGIFRLAGSNKRIKQLQIIFSSPPDYGAKINWDGYTVHDAASLLRRYLSSLAEPLIPLNFYDSFRDILIEKPELLQYLKNSDVKSPTIVNPELKKLDKATRKIIHSQRRQMLHQYADLFQVLPPIQKRVLFYLLDLLAMFSMKSEFNRMPAKNLAAIFQPSILSHPSHDMNPEEYVVNSLVIESMITYSHKILINIQNEKNESKKNNLEMQANESFGTDYTEGSINLNFKNEQTNSKKSTQNESITKPNLSASTIGSPLKHMITPLEQRNDLLELGGFMEPPLSPFAERNKVVSRPHSKSVSHTPHSEILRVNATSAVSVSSNVIKSDDRLSTTLSSQSDLSFKSITNSNLTDEINASPGPERPAVPESLNFVDNKANFDSDVTKYENTPNTPTMDTILKKQLTPTNSNEINNDENDNLEKHEELEHKHDELEYKNEDDSFHDCKSSDVASKSITSSSFSFQPSLLQGHISRQESELSANRTSDNKIERETSEQNTEATVISTGFIKDSDGVKFSHPDVTTDTSCQLYETTTSSNEDDASHSKKRSGSAPGTGIRTSTLFLLPHKIGMNINKSEPSSDNSSPTTPTKEKRNWLDKLKPRSNTKH